MYNGIAGGIGQGLQSFVQAYQTALNYQLEKSKAAALTDYQQKMANSADLTAKAGLLNAGGSPAVDQYDPDKNSQDADAGNAQVDKSLNDLQNINPPSMSTPTPPQKGLVNALAPGLVGPQPSPGMIAASQTSNQSAPTSQMPIMPTNQASNGRPVIFAPWQRQAMLAAQKEAADKNNAAAAAGTNEHYAVDPENPMVTKFVGQGPLTGKALLDQQKTNAEIAGEISGSRSPKQTIVDDFNKQSQFAQQSQMYTNQALKAFKDSSPQGDEALLTLAYKIHFPNAPDIPTLQAMSTSQSIPDSIRKAAYQKINGGIDPETKKNVLRDVITTNGANYETLQEMKSGFHDRFAGSNVTDESGLKTPTIDKTYKDSQLLLKQIGPYVPNSQRQNPGLMDRVAGFLGGGSPPASSSSAKGPPPGLSFQQFQSWKKSNGQ